MKRRKIAKTIPKELIHNKSQNETKQTEGRLEALVLDQGFL
jgi:hypothetical protein